MFKLRYPVNTGSLLLQMYLLVRLLYHLYLFLWGMQNRWMLILLIWYSLLGLLEYHDSLNWSKDLYLLWWIQMELLIVCLRALYCAFLQIMYCRYFDLHGLFCWSSECFKYMHMQSIFESLWFPWKQLHIVSLFLLDLWWVQRKFLLDLRYNEEIVFLNFIDLHMLRRHSRWWS